MSGAADCGQPVTDYESLFKQKACHRWAIVKSRVSCSGKEGEN